MSYFHINSHGTVSKRPGLFYDITLPILYFFLSILPEWRAEAVEDNNENNEERENNNENNGENENNEENENNNQHLVDPLQ